MTKKQQEWLNLKRLAAYCKPRRKYKLPSTLLRQWCHRLVLTDTFEKAMILVVIANVATMFLPHAGQSQAWQDAQNACSAAFAGIYVFEMLLKLLAIGPWAYFTTGWYLFDFFVALVSCIGVLLDYARFTNFHPTFFPLVRILRVLNLLKIIPKVKE